MSEQVTKHITETLKMMFAAYQTGTPSTTNSEVTPNQPIVSQPSGPRNDDNEEKENKDSLEGSQP